MPYCLCWGVCLHKDQLLKDPLTFKQNSSYELFCCFLRYIFHCFFTVLVVHPHHVHPITTVLTHYSPMARYSLFVLKVPLNTNQPTMMQFGVPMREELVTVCVGMHGDAGRVMWCMPCRGKKFEMFPMCRSEIMCTTARASCVTLGVTHFVNRS